MNTVLMRALADIAVFLTGSDDETINPDAAIRELEALASHLRQLRDPDRQAFSRFVTETLATEAHLAHDTDREAILRALPNDLGISD